MTAPTAPAPNAAPLSSTPWGPAVLAAAAVALVLAQAELWPLNGFWNDEFWSIWATDPNHSLAANLQDRILPDPNPPLYPALLYLARGLTDDVRLAFLLLNGASLAISVGVAATIARGMDAKRTGLASSAALLVSGPVVCYLPEGRAYTLSLSLVFVTSWLVAYALERQASWRVQAGFGLCGLLCAATHVYAGLFAVCLAGGLLAYGVAGKRDDLSRAALAMGVISTAFLAWHTASVSDIAADRGWIEFSAARVAEAAWYAAKLAFGSLVPMALVALLLGGAALFPRTRPLLLVFAVAYALFALAPIVVSLVQPVIVGRYWMIGAPGVLVLAALLVRALLLVEDARTRWARTALAAAAVIAAILGSASGYVTARRFTEAKPFWAGRLAHELAAACPPRSIRIAATGFGPAYPLAAGLPADRFVPVREHSAPIRTSNSSCPLLGWAEHVWAGPDFIRRAPDRQLTAMVGLALPPTDVIVVRRPSGFMVLASPARRRALAMRRAFDARLSPRFGPGAHNNRGG